MATLEQSQAKLERLEKEFNEAVSKAVDAAKATQGEPMGDKVKGRQYLRYMEKLNETAKSKKQQYENQLEVVERQKARQLKPKNRTEQIEKLKERISQQEQDIKDGHIHAYSKQYLSKDKKRLAELIALDEVVSAIEPSERVKQLVNDGKIKQWAKKPEYYFVIGLQKVALLLRKDGELHMSNKYPPKTEEEKSIVESLLLK